MEEIWECIPGYEGYYLISNKGVLKSIKNGRDKIRKTAMTKKGYLTYALSKDNVKRNFRAHQLVAMAFLNHNPCGMLSVIDHINNNKLDNRLENLRIVTSRDNHYKVKNGLNTSEHKGVHFDKDKRKWRAQTTINNKRKHIGFFETEEEAINSYNLFVVTYTLQKSNKSKFN
jgi:hypothetical protein